MSRTYRPAVAFSPRRNTRRLHKLQIALERVEAALKATRVFEFEAYQKLRREHARIVNRITRES